MRVEVDDGAWAHVVQIEEAEMRNEGLYAEGTDADADNVLYRMGESAHDLDDEVILERRHARDEEWEAVGPVTQIEPVE